MCLLERAHDSTGRSWLWPWLLDGNSTIQATSASHSATAYYVDYHQGFTQTHLVRLGFGVAEFAAPSLAKSEPRRRDVNICSFVWVDIRIMPNKRETNTKKGQADSNMHRTSNSVIGKQVSLKISVSSIRGFGPC